MRNRRLFVVLFMALVARPSLGELVVSIDHLATPSAYDNANSVPFGQTFIATAPNIAGMVVIIGDPNHDPDMTYLDGPASLVLYDATDAAAPVELGRTPILPTGDKLTGQLTLPFDAPIPTTSGGHYFSAIDTTDTYGIGLRDLTASTYDQGKESYISNGAIVGSSGRDLSFQILSDVPAFRCLGFAAPLDSSPVRVRGNRALPLRASLLNSSGSPITPSDIDAAPVVQVWFRSESGGEAQDITSQVLAIGQATSGNQFFFNGSEWQFNFNTSNLTAPGTYTIFIDTGSPATYTIQPTCSVDLVR